MDDIYLRDSYCGNSSPITGACMAGCRPGWCMKSSETRKRENAAMRARHEAEKQRTDASQ